MSRACHEKDCWATLFSGIRLKQAVRQQKDIQANRKKKGLYYDVISNKDTQINAKNSLLF